MDKKSDIFPIIVLYCCKLSESKTYNSLLKNKGIKAIMVYDNSPQNYQQEMMPDNVIYMITPTEEYPTPIIQRHNMLMNTNMTAYLFWIKTPHSQKMP